MIKAIAGDSSDAMSEHYRQFDAKLASEFAKRLTGKEAAALPPARAPIPPWALEKLATQDAGNWQAVKDERMKG
jgi:hypothetical protein